MLTPNDALDRDQMRALIFSNPAAKVQLEGIVHPLVAKAIAEQSRQADDAGARCIVFDIPLLVESRHWRQTFQRVLVVDCSEATQIHRVSVRNALSNDDIKKIIASQSPRVLRLRAADAVLFNDGITIEDLEQQVREIGTQFEL